MVLMFNGLDLQQIWYNYGEYGEVTERFKVTVLKTVAGRLAVGSNPTLSAKIVI